MPAKENPVKDIGGNGITIDARNFTRLPEIAGYAAQRNITVQAAIIELVNQGLSHL